MDSAAPSKICGLCGQDCANRSRTRDPTGRYFCTECYDRAIERKHLLRAGTLSDTDAALPARMPPPARMPAAIATPPSAPPPPAHSLPVANDPEIVIESQEVREVASSDAPEVAPLATNSVESSPVIEHLAEEPPRLEPPAPEHDEFDLHQNGSPAPFAAEAEPSLMDSTPIFAYERRIAEPSMFELEEEVGEVEIEPEPDEPPQLALPPKPVDESEQAFEIDIEDVPVDAPMEESAAKFPPEPQVPVIVESPAVVLPGPATIDSPLAPTPDAQALSTVASPVSLPQPPAAIAAPATLPPEQEAPASVIVAPPAATPPPQSPPATVESAPTFNQEQTAVVVQATPAITTPAPAPKREEAGNIRQMAAASASLPSASPPVTPRRAEPLPDSWPSALIPLAAQTHAGEGLQVEEFFSEERGPGAMLLEDGPPAAAFGGCPRCHRPMPTGAIVCLNCGHNIITGAVAAADISRPLVRRRPPGNWVGPSLAGAALTIAALVSGYLLFGSQLGLIAFAIAFVVALPAWFLWALIDARNIEGAQLKIWIVPGYIFGYVYTESRSRYLRAITVGVVAIIVMFAAHGYEWNRQEHEKERALHRMPAP